MQLSEYVKKAAWVLPAVALVSLSLNAAGILGSSANTMLSASSIALVGFVLFPLVRGLAQYFLSRDSSSQKTLTKGEDKQTVPQKIAQWVNYITYVLGLLAVSGLLLMQNSAVANFAGKLLHGSSTAAMSDLNLIAVSLFFISAVAWYAVSEYFAPVDNIKVDNKTFVNDFTQAHQAHSVKQSESFGYSNAQKHSNIMSPLLSASGRSSAQNLHTVNLGGDSEGQGHMTDVEDETTITPLAQDLTTPHKPTSHINSSGVDTQLAGGSKNALTVTLSQPPISLSPVVSSPSRLTDVGSEDDLTDVEETTTIRLQQNKPKQKQQVSSPSQLTDVDSHADEDVLTDVDSGDVNNEQLTDVETPVKVGGESSRKTDSKTDVARAENPIARKTNSPIHVPVEQVAYEGDEDVMTDVDEDEGIKRPSVLNPIASGSS